jgi:hypothetical protein
MSVKLPNLDTFLSRQEVALRKAITRGRSRARTISTPGIGGSPGFGLNRANPSRIEAKLKWFASQGVANLPGKPKPTEMFRPDWEAIREDLYDALFDLGEVLIEAFDEHLGGQALTTESAWPVDTGLSKALLYLSEDIDEKGDATGSLGGGAPYTPYIEEPGYRIEVSEYTDRKGRTRTRRKRARGDAVKGPDGKWRLPNWKAQYLVKNPDGTYRFDKIAYEARKRGSGFVDLDRRTATGRPYRDLIVKPGKKIAQAIGEAAVERTADRLNER